MSLFAKLAQIWRERCGLPSTEMDTRDTDIEELRAVGPAPAPFGLDGDALDPMDRTDQEVPGWMVSNDMEL